MSESQEKEFKDLEKDIIKTIKRGIKVWKNLKTDQNYFYSFLHPFIRVKRLEHETKTVHCILRDKVNEYKFKIFYNYVQRLYRFKTEEKHLEFIKNNGLVSKGSYNFNEYLTLILNEYKKENVKTPEKKLSITEVKHKVYLEFLKTWMKYEKKLPNNVTNQHLECKNNVTNEIVKFFKQHDDNIHLRPLNTFMYSVEFFPEYFKEVFPKVYQELLEVEMSLIIEIRIKIGFPKIFPLIRIIQPRLNVKNVSKGGIFLKEFAVKEKKYFNNLLELLIVNLFQDNKDPIQNTGYEFYDDHLALIDFKRLLLNSKNFGIENNYTSKLYCFSPIFHFGDASDPFTEKKIEDFEIGNKIILPNDCVNKIFKNNPNVKLPLFFEIKSPHGKTFCGVKEFTSGRNRIILPVRIIKQLGVNDGEMLKVNCIKPLPLCNLVKLQPQDPNFFVEVENPKFLLESQLKNYYTLTIGDELIVRYGEKKFKVDVLELKPNDVCSIIPNKSGFLEIKLQIIPPLHFNPKLHKKEILPSPDVEDYYEDLKTPIKITGAKYVSCENCCHSVNEISYNLHLRFCKKTYYKCEKCNNRIIKVINKEKHEKEFHREVKCDDCGEKMEKRNLKLHSKNDCEKRMVKCKYLNCPVIAKDLVFHEMRCGDKTEKCQKCQKYFMIKNREVHLVDCKYGTTEKDFKEKKLQKDLLEAMKIQEEENLKRALELSQKKVCMFCKSLFDENTLLFKHIVKFHFDEEKQTNCPQCKRSTNKLGLHLISFHHNLI